MKLYGSPLSGNTTKVRIAALEIGLPLEFVVLDITKAENRGATYLEKNPMGKVPTIDDDGFVLWESGAILEYLAGKKPEAGLLPVDARGRADVMRWVIWGAAHLHPSTVMLMLERVIKPRLGQPGNDPHLIAHAQSELDRFLPVLEGQLQDREHVTGRYTIADIALGTAFSSAALMGLDLGGYPNIRGWSSRLEAREAWKLARGS